MRRTFLAAIASILLLTAFVVLVGPVALGSQLAGTDLPVFALGLVSMLGALVVWSEGLGALLAGSGIDVSRWRLLVAYTAAMLGRQVLPLGAIGGPVVTAFTVEREIDQDYDETLAVVVVAEFLSTIASLTVAGVGIGLLLGEVAAVSELRLLVYGTLAFAVLFLVTVAVVLLARGAVARSLLAATQFTRHTLGPLSPWIDTTLAPGRMGASIERFYDAIDRTAADRSSVLVSFLLHLLGWLCAALPLYTSAAALDTTLSIPIVLLLVPTMGLVDILPLPGGLGGVELVLGALIVAVSGVSVPLAAAVVVLYRLCTYWFLLLIGSVASIVAIADVHDLFWDE